MKARVSRRGLLEGFVFLVPDRAIAAVGRPAGAFSTETMNVGGNVGRVSLVLAGRADIVLTFCVS